VRISGGGRCNVTYHCFEPTPLSQHYPRGKKNWKSIPFLHAKDTVDWLPTWVSHWRRRPNGRMFPVTDDSQTIIDCFLKQSELLHIGIATTAESVVFLASWTGFRVHLMDNREIISKKGIGSDWRASNKQPITRGLKIWATPSYPPIPRFLLSMIQKRNSLTWWGFRGLRGSENCGKQNSPGGSSSHYALGLSGPAVIRLSAWAADYLHQNAYELPLLLIGPVQWVKKLCGMELNELRTKSGGRMIAANPLFKLSHRFVGSTDPACGNWRSQEMGWCFQQGYQPADRVFIRCPFTSRAKTTLRKNLYRVGVDLKEVTLETMESKKVRWPLLCRWGIKYRWRNGWVQFSGSMDHCFSGGRGDWNGS